MNPVLLNFRLIFIASTLAVLISPLLGRLAERVGLVDRPNSEAHKLHDKTVPLAGGLAIAVALFCVSFAGGLFINPEVRAILAAGAIAFVFGLLDDFKPLSPGWKLLGQIFASVVLVLLGVRVQIFRWDFVNIAITIFWIVGVTNAFNFVDSMDGLASGLAGVASGLFMLVAYDSGQFELSSFSAVLVGICVSVYYFSAFPARYFLGDSGAQFLGFILGGIAIVYNPQGFLPTQSWFIPILLLGIPIYDTVLVVFSRIKAGKPIYRSALDHTYHRLVKKGMHPYRAVLTMHLGAIFLGCLAFIALSLPPVWANLIFGTIIFVGFVSMVYLEKWKLAK